MTEIDQLIQLIYDNLDGSDYITLKKSIRYGFRHYHLIVSIGESDELNAQKPWPLSFSLHFDNRNKCIEISELDGGTIFIEGLETLEKWSGIFEKRITSELEVTIEDKIFNLLNSCQNKSLLRQYQMKKLIK
jgi:hypothetical protein